MFLQSAVLEKTLPTCAAHMFSDTLMLQTVYLQAVCTHVSFITEVTLIWPVVSMLHRMSSKMITPTKCQVTSGTQIRFNSCGK